jgi:phage terminase small subunit
MLSSLDAVLEMFCTSYSRWLEHDGGRGYPALTACVTHLARELGPSPAMRLRLPAPEADSDVEAEIFGRRPLS